ncbi:MAG: FHA domain-containing protein [Firmicutes bacterium]|nr:FHA domain-containing protein [Bacillota bacterium]
MYGVLFDEAGKKKLTINKEREFFIGRKIPDDEGFSVDDEYVSRRHASISFDKEFYIKDLNSKNGSYINGRLMDRGETLALTDGDMLRFGNSEYCFRIAKPVKAENVYGGYRCSIKNSAGGRRLRVELPERGCTEHQLRMIEENSELQVAGIIYVKNIESDCILCDIGGCLNLSEHIKQYRKSVDAEELIENILETVKKGEEHLLERKRYVIHPETVFLDKNEKIKLIYVPGAEEKNDDFSLQMRDMCRFLSKQYTGKERERIAKLAGIFENMSGDATAEHIKALYRMKDIKSGNSEDDNHTFIRVTSLGKEYLVTLASFALFMTAFWTEAAGRIGTVMIFVIFLSVNIFIYGVKGEKRKTVYSYLKKIVKNRY